MYDSKQTFRRAVWCYVFLLPVAALLVSGANHDPLSWTMYMIVAILVDAALCLFLGTVCMFLGFAVAIVNQQASMNLIGFGAALALIFFRIALMMRYFGVHRAKKD